MKNYEDLLLERVQILTGKLAQKQREGCLTEELSLCIRLAQLHGQLDSPKVSVQFWQSCMQIADDLGEEDEIWRAAAEIAKIYCKEGQIDEAERFMKEHLKVTESSNESESLRLSLLKSEVIAAMAPKNREISVKEFLIYERALKVLDCAFELTTNENIWWWEAVAFRAELLRKLAKYDESRYKEAIDVVNAIQNGGINGHVLMSLRCRSILSKIYFDMREYATALESAISAIDQYKSDVGNANYRPRRRIYCEMLLLAGRTLRFQKDFNFALQNLLLAKDEAQALTVEKELIDEISAVTQELIRAQSDANEVTLLERKKNPTPKDLEELASKFGGIGDFERQLELLEKCRTVATSESARRRLDKKLINLYFNEFKNWSAVSRMEIESKDWRSLILKGQACTNLCKFEQAEEFLLEALRLSDEDVTVHAALFFYYRQRGKMTIAEKYEAEALSLETIDDLNTKVLNSSSLIDANFSYFATRKPSNSLMKMIGSGMMMKTKTRKTRGLQLKRRRGPSRPSIATGAVRMRRSQEYDEDSGLSDFIVSEEEGEEEEEDFEGERSDIERIDSDKKKLESSRSLIFISSSDESEPEVKRTVDKVVAEFGFESPLMIRTETLDQPISVECRKEGLKSQNNDDRSNTKNNQNKRNSKRVVVRFKKGMDVLIPTAPDVTVKELIKIAQTRLKVLFPEESKGLGQISGLSINNSAMLFPDDLLDIILTGDSEILEAHFKRESEIGIEIEIESPSHNTIEEDFKRKIQILNLRANGNDEIKFLKTFKERFKTDQVLDLSSLSIDSKKFSEYSSFINKFLKISNNLKILNLKENLLCDEDLRSLSNFSCHEINLSSNFLQKPNMKFLLNYDFIDFSYNPINAKWLINQNFKNGLNLIGCFELKESKIFEEEEEVWDDLGIAFTNLKNIKISFIPKNSSRFFSNFCSGTSLEEIEFFGINWKSEILVELSYLDRLRSLNFISCSFNRVALEALGKVLRRTCSLEFLSFKEIEFLENDWLLIEEGIKSNFSIKKVVKE